MRLTACQFLRVFYRVRVIGSLPPDGAMVIAPVHRSYLDIPLLGLITKREIRFMAKRELFTTPGLSHFFRALGAYEVNRGEPDLAAIKKSLSILKQDWPLCIFPEGTRLSGTDVGSLETGVVYLANRTGVPVVPVGIAGSEKALGKHGKFIRFSRITIVIGEAMRLGPEKMKKDQLEDTTLLLRERLQDVFDRARAL